MRYGSCFYNPIKDKTPVSDTGYIDLQSAFVHHTLPPNIAGAENDYNGIAEPASILGKPRDVFEGLDMQKAINNYKPDNDGSNSA